MPPAARPRSWKASACGSIWSRPRSIWSAGSVPDLLVVEPPSPLPGILGQLSVIRPKTVGQALFGEQQSGTRNEPEVSALLEQYKLLLGTSESSVSRRQLVNSFFLSVNSILLAVRLGLRALTDPLDCAFAPKPFLYNFET